MEGWTYPYRSRPQWLLSGSAFVAETAAVNLCVSVVYNINLFKINTYIGIHIYITKIYTYKYMMKRSTEASSPDKERERVSE